MTWMFIPLHCVCGHNTWQLHLFHSWLMISCLAAEGPSAFADIIVSAGPGKKPLWVTDSLHI